MSRGSTWSLTKSYLQITDSLVKSVRDSALSLFVWFWLLIPWSLNWMGLPTYKASRLWLLVVQLPFFATCWQSLSKVRKNLEEAYKHDSCQNWADCDFKWQGQSGLGRFLIHVEIFFYRKTVIMFSRVVTYNVTCCKLHTIKKDFPPQTIWGPMYFQINFIIPSFQLFIRPICFDAQW